MTYCHIWAFSLLLSVVTIKQDADTSVLVPCQY